MKTKDSSKEIAVAKAQATKALQAAESIVIKTDDNAEQAGIIRKKIQDVGRLIKAKKEKITKPLNEALRETRDLFRPIEDSHAEATRVIGQKLLSYTQEQREKQEKEKERIAARVDRGTMKPETAMKKAENMPEAKKSGVAFATRKIQKVRLAQLNRFAGEDLQKLALDGYIKWDEISVRKDALSGKTIVGVEVYEEEIIATK